MYSLSSIAQIKIVWAFCAYTGTLQETVCSDSFLSSVIGATNVLQILQPLPFGSSLTDVSIPGYILLELAKLTHVPSLHYNPQGQAGKTSISRVVSLIWMFLRVGCPKRVLIIWWQLQRHLLSIPWTFQDNRFTPTQKLQQWFCRASENAPSVSMLLVIDVSTFRNKFSHLQFIRKPVKFLTIHCLTEYVTHAPSGIKNEKN